MQRGKACGRRPDPSRERGRREVDRGGAPSQPADGRCRGSSAEPSDLAGNAAVHADDRRARREHGVPGVTSVAPGMRLEIFDRGSYRSGAENCAADRPLLRHPPRWHHQHRGIRCECPIHAAGTAWLGHSRRLNGWGSGRQAGSGATTVTAITPHTPGPEGRPSPPPKAGPARPRRQAQRGPEGRPGRPEESGRYDCVVSAAPGVQMSVPRVRGACALISVPRVRSPWHANARPACPYP